MIILLEKCIWIFRRNARKKSGRQRKHRLYYWKYAQRSIRSNKNHNLIESRMKIIQTFCQNSDLLINKLKIITGFLKRLYRLSTTNSCFCTHLTLSFFLSVMFSLLLNKTEYILVTLQVTFYVITDFNNYLNNIFDLFAWNLIHTMFLYLHNLTKRIILKYSLS